MILGGSADAQERTAHPSIDEQVAAMRATALQTWGVSGEMALENGGFDLYRAVYDVYAIHADRGWAVCPGSIDAHQLNSSSVADGLARRRRRGALLQGTCGSL